MKETQEILLKMGFTNPGSNVWRSDWFDVFLLSNTATPEELAKFIYNRGIKTKVATQQVSGWIEFKGNEKLFEKYAFKNCLCLFDNGVVCRYLDQQPIAILTHFKL